MKKLLLVAGLTLSSVFTMNAQSFEVSEGFAAGNINAQNGWFTTTYGPELYVENQVISDEYASDGTLAIKIDLEGDFPGQSNPVVGAFSPDMEVTGTQVEVSYDFYPATQADGGSDFCFSIYNGDDFAARVNFNYMGMITIVDNGIDPETEEPGLFYIPTEIEWAPESWYSVRIVFDYATEVATYYLDDELIYTGDVLAPTFTRMAMTHDNWEGFAYFDNISVTDISLGNTDFLSSKLAVYPNPASSIVNLSNDANILINTISIADINGRTVKTVAGNALSTTQINVADLSSGMYVMTIDTNQGSVTKKLVKN